ncbi:MAG: double-strand break repair protein AddB [Bdellovibrionales bacterium]
MISGALTGIFYVGRGVPFLAALADGLRARAGGDPLALSGMRVLLPNRRSVRALKEVFLRATDGAPTLLPRMISLGDLGDDTDAQLGLLASVEPFDDIPPPIGSVERQLLLSKFVRQKDKDISAAQGIALACDLARLLDEMTAYGVQPQQLIDLPHKDFPEHWQRTAEFLGIISTLWPDMLKQMGRSDPAAYRKASLERLADAWQKNPPLFPVVLAGVQRAEPAVIKLARTVAAHGTVLLPAFDDADKLGREDWAALDVVHPDYLLRQMVDALAGGTRSAVAVWPHGGEPACGEARRDWLRLSMQPTTLTERWVAQAPKVVTEAAMQGIDLLECADESAEAEAIALCIREELETPARTIMLLTPDRVLARRVAMLLKRWGIDADDSSGQPLLLSPLGVYLQLVAAAADPAANTAVFLALLKHSLCGAGVPSETRALTLARLEAECLRGRYPATGVAGFVSYVMAVADDDAVRTLVANLQKALQPFAALCAQNHAPAPQLLQAHLQAAEDLAATATESGTALLWANEKYINEAEAASQKLLELRACLTTDHLLQQGEYAAWLAQLLGAGSVRVPYGQHPRVVISGLIEARLQQADVMILSGLNEGTWPALPPVNAWINRRMRAVLGLPDPETEITSAAHDFVSGAAAQRVYLTRALRQNGTPTVPARWLMRLQATLAAVGLDKTWKQRGAALAVRASLLDSHKGEVRPVDEPKPAPPPAVRPRQISATEVEKLMGDPYGYYARHILKLRELKKLEDTPDAAEKGTFAHRVLEDFYKQVGERPLQDDDWPLLQAIVQEKLRAYEGAPGIPQLWNAWMLDVTAWLQQQERKNQPARLPKVLEGSGTRVWKDRNFTLKAKADRIDIANDDIVIVDYKTGTPPTGPSVAKGKAPQLPLEALIAQAGGYGKELQGRAVQMEYWKLGSTQANCEVKEIKKIDIAAAEEQLLLLVSELLDKQTPYLFEPAADMKPKYNAYKHLARQKEWAFADDGDDDGGAE